LVSRTSEIERMGKNKYWEAAEAVYLISSSTPQMARPSALVQEAGWR